ncbi:uncharacterized protein LOC121010043 [Herpailurus yagouaroundi]|uniref:uncharacterized protein LOC121010043 n=1 Tax=Herpailurus yagouaroundi TaxID=1608482 RepID=UPI001AD63372|nr:uncharacterized protein LOC121010043 [Puma yagouaroundi]
MAVAAGMLMGPLRREKQEWATGSYLSHEMWAAFPSLDLGLPIGKEHFGLYSQATSGSRTPVWDHCICFLGNRSVFLWQGRLEKSLCRTKKRPLCSLASGKEGCNLHERGRQQYTDGSSVIAFLCLIAPGALHLGLLGSFKLSSRETRTEKNRLAEGPSCTYVEGPGGQLLPRDAAWGEFLSCMAQCGPWHILETVTICLQTLLLHRVPRYLVKHHPGCVCEGVSGAD